jgi:hypothetical protein
MNSLDDDEIDELSESIMRLRANIARLWFRLKGLEVVDTDEDQARSTEAGEDPVR